MREIEITIKCSSGEHPMIAYADACYPGLAVHGPWALGDDAWRVTHGQAA